MSNQFQPNIKKSANPNIIGLIPAGGIANRLAPLPCSKELYPVGFRKISETGGLRSKVISQYILENMRMAGITRAYFILRKGKWDIPSYYGDGTMLNMNIAYLMMNLPYGVPYTIDQAYPFIKDSKVAFGFPDIIFHPSDAFIHLVEEQESSEADLVLGLFPVENPQKFDMVEQDSTGRIKKIDIKPKKSHLKLTWIIAIWTPVFTSFLHEFVKSSKQHFIVSSEEKDTSPKAELQISDVIQNAIQSRLKVATVTFPKGHFIDIGTPEDLIKILGNIDCRDNMG